MKTENQPSVVKISDISQFSMQELKSQNKSIKQYFKFMNTEIRDQSFLKGYFLCCSTQAQISSIEFEKAFRSMNHEEQNTYFAKNVNFFREIVRESKENKSDKQMKKAQQQQSEQLEQRIQLMVKQQNTIPQWKLSKIKINYDEKIIEVPNMLYSINLKQYLLRTSKNKQFQAIVLEPMVPFISQVRIGTSFRGQFEFFEKIRNCMDICLKEQIKDMATISQYQIPKSIVLKKRNTDTFQNEEEKQIKIQKYVSELRKTQEKLNVFKYKHILEPLQKTQPRLIDPKNSKDQYLFENEWRITEKGEMIGINEDKIKAQAGIFKFIFKKIFEGGKILSISLPVQVFGNDSLLNRLCDSYRFAPLILEDGIKLIDPLQRLKRVIGFAMSCPKLYIKMDKPFNPILGETYQALANGTLVYGEQISHHPPISAIYIQGRGYTIYGTFQSTIQFGFNSAHGTNQGWVHIAIQKQHQPDQIVQFTNPVGQLSGLLLGERTFNLIKTQYFLDVKNLLFCKLSYEKGQDKTKPFHKFYDCVQGKVYKLKQNANLSKVQDFQEQNFEKELGMIHGRWTDDVYFNDEILIKIKEHIPMEIQTYPVVLPSDASLREDLVLRNAGELDQAQQEKERLEEIQRRDRKLREKYQS